MRFGVLSLIGFSTFFALFSLQAPAEYRVFLLNIVTTPPKAPPSATQGAPPTPPAPPAPEVKPNLRQVKSSLDPLQYVRYYPLAANETISYTETWMCKGNTSGEKPYCDNPKNKSRTPASRPDPDQKP